MHIEEITIDGFKSYAQRVVVGKFDPHFNAITGLNGSGKSNILDSICFVLGINNLSQVRANSLQDLVYKSGQAGVTKASVSIVFNNEDKDNSPVGYEEHDRIVVTRQIVIGGRNKYQINGQTANPSRVQNLFHSVQLNVNNPHFLIMQGRITKVLNMKPPEILSMLEEAAGTRMYETKKEAALKTLEKKQSKVNEIDTVLAEILGAMDQLKSERAAFLEFSTLRSRADEMKRFLVAWQWTRQRELVQSGGEAGAMRTLLEQAQAAAAEARADIRDAEADMERVAAEKERREDAEMAEIKARVDKATKALVTRESALASKKESLAGERKAMASLEGQLGELDPSALDAAAAAAERARDAARAEAQAAAQAAEAAARELAGARAGDGRDESNRSMQERLADARNSQTAARAETRKAETAASLARKELQEARKALARKDKEAKAMRAAMDKARAGVEAARAELAQLAFDEARAAAVAGERDAAERAVAHWTGVCGQLEPRARAAEFHYAMPRPPPGFRPEAVRGTVAQLIRVRDPQMATALEVAAGKKLREVVVDTDDTAKALLKYGRLKSRTTFVPLNRIKAPGIPEDRLARARDIAGDKAVPAIDLVDFDPAVEAAVRYALGGVLVCRDDRTAKALAFSREVAVRCVTLQGDDFNPSGILSGGSRDQGPQLLATLTELAAARAQLDQHRAALSALAAEHAALESARDRHARLAQALELKEHEARLLGERAEVSEAHRLATRVEDLEKELSASEEAKAAAEARVRAAEEETARLEHEIEHWAEIRGQREREAEARVKETKGAAAEAKRRQAEAEGAYQAALAEREAAAGEREAVAERTEAAREAVAALEGEVAVAEAAVASAREEAARCREALESARAELRACDQDLSRLARRKAQAARQLEKAEEEVANRQQQLAGAQGEVARAERALAQMERQEPWIATEKVFFGVPGSRYDFAEAEGAGGFEKYQQEHDQMEAEIKKRDRSINKKALAMFDKVEQEYQQLAEKKRIVQNDRDKIERVIAELDEKKREALDATWRKVDKDFGSIFSTLLPGTSAKLEPPEGARSFLEGLEVRVAFGGVWKQSLTELSGGQRSLLALSLILALLLFKPAPIYILDEVDAALDLSHTQNIGRMIKAHFPYSQFIVVSLKEGMFNNANTLFRTKFVDGVSTVTRTVPTRPAADAAGAAQGKGAGRARPALAENMR